ncbi:hypothetical protein RD792_001858 [Penstemon davidsonii]|uniref:Uncharacterized protein n=1 Tax=Penstemon davidsonii TaxID=160366 RepID=A0ABR0DPG4_9LAMI|nr:hypothetical protein RD792_001858 [Penstemon davidsonii]
MKIYYLFFFLLFQTLTNSPSISAVQYQVLNDAKDYPGGVRFEREIGIPYTLEIMKTINYFIWDIFKQYNNSDRNPVETVHVNIREYDGAEAITSGAIVNVSSIYLKGYQGNLKWEFTSLLHHELTHVFQWTGEWKAPIGLIEGMADYMILKSNYYPPAFAKPGMGDKWDQGYDFTARFLEYCEELRSGFVAELNRKMRKDYSDEYFVELMGKPVGQLWSEYKAKYGNSIN